MCSTFYFFFNKHFLYDCITIFQDTLYAYGILLEGIRVLFSIWHLVFRLSRKASYDDGVVLRAREILDRCHDAEQRTGRSLLRVTFFFHFEASNRL